MQPLAGVLVGLFAANVCFVYLNDLVRAAERATLDRMQFAHCLANAHRHEPSRLVCDAEHPVHLMARHALFARREQMRGEQPRMQRNMRPLEQRADANREILPALARAAAIDPDLLRLVRVADRAAMRADRANRPADFL